jgi:septal ring factor EnvC (AmiA/AmiB activator)
MSPLRKNSVRQSRVVKVAAVALVMCLGVWGCARKPVSRADDPALETRVAKLEQDLRTTSHARDKARKDLANLEAESARSQQEAKEKLEAAQAERDAMHNLLVARTNDLRQQVSQRIAERDTFHTRVDKLRKGMQELLTQDEAPAASPGTPGGSPTPSASNAGPSLGGRS